MALRFLFLFSALTLSASSLAVTRFDSDQLSFTLYQEGLPSVSCKHQPLKSVTPVPAPPWWTVTCEDRTYTVDVWMSEQLLTGDRWKISLMLHAKEGTASSGERLVQFQNHFTQLVLSGESHVHEISSSLDIRNGLASLDVSIKIDKP
ncbi:MAG: hypothetical protein AAF202_06535 [Pseudomonadota bacterium]